MATTSTDVLLLSEAPPAPPARPRVLLVGVGLATGSAAMLLLTMIAIYVKLRHDVLAAGDAWLPEEANLQLTPGGMGMVTLAMSAVTASWAAWSLKHEDRIHAFWALGTTLLLGAAFINGCAFGWQQLGLGIDDSTQALLIYVISGTHVAMVVAGMLFMTVMTFRALGGQLTGRAAEGLAAATIYWYVTVALYAVIWYGIYITK